MPKADELRAQIAELESQLAKEEEAERKAAMAGNAKRATALLSAVKAGVKEIDKLFPGTFSGGVWADLTPQAWPRDTAFKRAADLSETEVSDAREAGKKAVDALK